MKQLNLYAALLWICLLCISSTTLKAENITLTQAGTLYDRIGQGNLEKVTTLTVSGPMNGDDIACLRDMLYLETLNMKSAQIVAGGIPYYNKYTTENNVIGSYMFYGLSNLVNVVLPESVTRIGNYNSSGSALANCINLKSITLPPALISVGQYSFQGCISLESISFPSTTPASISFSYAIFSGCTALKDVKLPTTLKELSSAFVGCSSLATIPFPAGLQGTGSFSGCSSLTTIAIPEGVTSIGSFADCTALKSITLPSTLVGMGDFKNCAKLTTINLPEGISSLLNSAFSGCRALTSISLPSRLNDIGSYAFQNCVALKSLVLPTRITTIGSGTFAGCTALESIELPRITTLENEIFSGCAALTTVKFPNDLLSIGNRAFYNCTSLSSITLPRNLSTIGSWAFGNCNIKELIISEGITAIPSGNIFSGSNIESISFPSTMKNIGGFSGAYIKNISIPEGAKKILPNAFSRCTQLTSVSLPAGIDSIGVYAFYECTSLTNMAIPEGVVSIDNQAFGKCEALETVTLPTTLKHLGAAFQETSLTTITIPAGIDSIASGTFFNCRKLETVTLPASVTRICGSYTNSSTTNYGAFRSCTKLQNIDLKNIIEIGKEAFYDCQGMTSLNLPKATSIGESAFERCYQVTEINIGSVTTLKLRAFFNCNKISYLQIPASLTQVETGVFAGTSPTTVEWNASIEIPANTFNTVRYLFIPDGITGKSVNATYLIRNGLADTFTPETTGSSVDGKYISTYSIPKAFKAKKATYKRRFTQNSGVGEAAGWETIVLPFSASQFVYTGLYESDKLNIPLAPFGSDALQTEGTRPFWLYEMSAEGAKAATTIEAHKPYLICMPNNNKYPSSSNIYGDVHFIGEDATDGVLISETAGKLNAAIGKEYNLVPTYQTVLASESVYKLNSYSWYADYPQGSVFVKNLGNIEPFCAYATPATAQAAKAPHFSIGFGEGGATGLEQELFMTPNKAVKVTTNEGTLYIESNRARMINLYDVSGRTLRTIKLKEGSNTVTDLADGIYFLEGQKVLIKH